MNRAVALTLLLAGFWAVGSVWYYDCAIKTVCGPDGRPVSTTEADAVTELSESEIQAVPDAPAAASSSVQTRIAEVEVVAAPAVDRIVTAPPTLTVRFDQKSSDLLPPADAETVLVAFRKAVSEGKHLVVTGHSDSRGARERIAIVSKERADALRAWLIIKGVPPEAIIKVESREDREPIADNNTAEGRALNRRAVVTLAP